MDWPSPHSILAMARPDGSRRGGEDRKAPTSTTDAADFCDSGHLGVPTAKDFVNSREHACRPDFTGNPLVQHLGGDPSGKSYIGGSLQRLDMVPGCAAGTGDVELGLQCALEMFEARHIGEKVRPRFRRWRSSRQTESSRRPRRRRLEQFPEKCAAVFRPEWRRSTGCCPFRASAKSGNASTRGNDT